MKKTINFVEKKELIIVTILTFLIAITGLFATYAIDTKLGYNDTTEYDMSLTFDLSNSLNKQVIIPAGKTKFFDIDVKNSNNGKLQYGIAYSMVSPASLPSGVLVGQSSVSANPSKGMIDANSTIPVTIAVENTSSTDITISLSIIYGYEKGGDLIIPSGKTLITEEYEVIKIPVMMGETSDYPTNFLNTGIARSSIESMEFIKISDVPSGVGEPVDISLNQDNTVLFYSKEGSTSSKYKTYIATDDGKVKLSSGYYIFYNLTRVTSLDLSNVITTGVTSMEGMFYNLSNNVANLTLFDLSNLDTSSVINMVDMLRGIKGLRSLDLSNFDTSNVTDMTRMFYGVSGFTSKNLTIDLTIDLSNFETSNVTNMTRMFSSSYFISLDISSFDTSNVTSMEGMFNSMYKLTMLNLGNINTSNVTNMNSMFSVMTSLTSLDISNLDTINVTDMTRMFASSGSLKTIYVSDKFITSNVTNSSAMFSTCTSLVGGNGTKYSTSYLDKTYARLDTSSTPGYFTKK